MSRQIPDLPFPGPPPPPSIIDGYIANSDNILASLSIPNTIASASRPTQPSSTIARQQADPQSILERKSEGDEKAAQQEIVTASDVILDDGTRVVHKSAALSTLRISKYNPLLKVRRDKDIRRLDRVVDALKTAERNTIPSVDVGMDDLDEDDAEFVEKGVSIGEWVGEDGEEDEDGYNEEDMDDGTWEGYDDDNDDELWAEDATGGGVDDGSKPDQQGADKGRANQTEQGEVDYADDTKEEEEEEEGEEEEIGLQVPWPSVFARGGIEIADGFGSTDSVPNTSNGEISSKGPDRNSDPCTNNNNDKNSSAGRGSSGSSSSAPFLPYPPPTAPPIAAPPPQSTLTSSTLNSSNTTDETQHDPKSAQEAKAPSQLPAEAHLSLANAYYSFTSTLMACVETNTNPSHSKDSGPTVNQTTRLDRSDGDLHAAVARELARLDSIREKMVQER